MNRRTSLVVVVAAVCAGAISAASYKIAAQPPPPPPALDAPPPDPAQRGKCVGISASVDPTRRGMVILVRAWEDGSFETRLLGSEAFAPSEEWRAVR